MFTVGICDDGHSICSYMEKEILNYAKRTNRTLTVQVWYSGESLCEYLKQGNHLDILYLDIELLEVNGIEVGSFIRNQLEDRMMQIIYISGKQSYAQSLFKTQPMDFLIKPISEVQIEESMELALKIIGRNSDKFEFQFGKEYYYIPYGEIIYLVSYGRKIRVLTIHGEKEFYGKLKEINKKLPGDFLLIHNSYVVNRQHIARYTYEMVELDNGEMLNISQSCRKQVREKLLKEL